MDRDKNMYNGFFTSISHRLNVVIKVGVRQIAKADYGQIEAEELLFSRYNELVSKCDNTKENEKNIDITSQLISIHIFAYSPFSIV